MKQIFNIKQNIKINIKFIIKYFFIFKNICGYKILKKWRNVKKHFLYRKSLLNRHNTHIRALLKKVTINYT